MFLRFGTRDGRIRAFLKIVFLCYIMFLICKMFQWLLWDVGDLENGDDYGINYNMLQNTGITT